MKNAIQIVTKYTALKTRFDATAPLNYSIRVAQITAEQVGAYAAFGWLVIESADYAKAAKRIDRKKLGGFMNPKRLAAIRLWIGNQIGELALPQAKAAKEKAKAAIGAKADTIGLPALLAAGVKARLGSK
jgi:hypothetical protein